MVSGTFGSSSAPQDEEPKAPPATPNEVSSLISKGETVVEEVASKVLHEIAKEVENVAEKLDHRLNGGVDITPFFK